MQSLNKEVGNLSFNVLGDSLFWENLEELAHTRYKKELEGIDAFILVHKNESIDGITKLQGSFSVIIENKDKKTTEFARDPFGRMPLFHLIDRGGILASFNIKDLLDSSSKEIEQESLLKFISLKGIPEEKTIIKDIKRIPPGSIAVFKDGKLEKTRYKSYRLSPGDRSEKEIINKIRKSLVKTLQSYPKKENALLVSGGLDSTILLALNTIEKPWKGFGIEIEGMHIGISDVDVLKEKYDFEYKEIFVKPEEIRKNFKKTIQIMDLPFVDHTAGLLAAAFRQMPDTALMSGKGADEFFYREKQGNMVEKLSNEMSFLNNLYNGERKELWTPYLEGEMADIAMELPQALRDKKPDKYIMRRAFGSLLPPQIVAKARKGSEFPPELSLPEDAIDLIKQSRLVQENLPDKLIKKAMQETKHKFPLTVLASWDMEFLQES